MRETATTLIRIKQILPGLKGNNRRIAEHVLASPELLMSQKVSDMAEACSCDAAQVVRFCKQLGFKGFAELKMRLAQELIPLSMETGCERLESSDVFEQLRRDYCRSVTQTMTDTVMHLDKATAMKAVKTINDARRIVVCGVGASNLTAQDLHCKLMRMGFCTFCFSDVEMQKITSELLGKSDLLIVLSFSGGSETVLQCMRTVKSNGGAILLITNYLESKAARLADMMLCTAAEEDKLRLGAMSSRLAQLAVIDMLLSLLVLEYPDETTRNILRTYNAIKYQEER